MTSKFQRLPPRIGVGEREDGLDSSPIAEQIEERRLSVKFIKTEGKLSQRRLESHSSKCWGTSVDSISSSATSIHGVIGGHERPSG
ncbi:MAG: hypothetical protein CL694_15165 [Chloroflexi bacterium]|nr:hypothetical protein [Chloroflexota bacterium]HAL48399.1 hypothetical protein [Dehalococcoidia bacterium]